MKHSGELNLGITYLYKYLIFVYCEGTRNIKTYSEKWCHHDFWKFQKQFDLNTNMHVGENYNELEQWKLHAMEIEKWIFRI